MFGFLGDALGRSAVYGKELIIVIVSVIVMISAPDYLQGHGITIWLTFWRLMMGIGIGGDYPMSAAVVSDRAHLNKRGAMLAWIFSNQGWGNLAGGILAVFVIAGYRNFVDAGQIHKLSGAWRILQGLSLIPAFISLYFRLTLVESTRFTQARAIQDDPELLNKSSANGVIVGEIDSEDELALQKAGGDVSRITNNTRVGLKFGTIGQKAHNEFFEYFSEWHHLKPLIGCSLCWFLVDITFYGINLNQSAILTAINFTTGSTWGKLMKTATGNLIITCAGFFPGYFITVATIEWIGRKPIQMLGFTMNMLFLGILGGMFNELKTRTGPFFVVFVFLQLFFNWGANATTFIIAAECEYDFGSTSPLDISLFDPCEFVCPLKPFKLSQPVSVPPPTASAPPPARLELSSPPWALRRWPTKLARRSSSGSSSPSRLSVFSSRSSSSLRPRTTRPTRSTDGSSPRSTVSRSAPTSPRTPLLLPMRSTPLARRPAFKLYLADVAVAQSTRSPKKLGLHTRGRAVMSHQSPISVSYVTATSSFSPSFSNSWCITYSRSRLFACRQFFFGFKIDQSQLICVRVVPAVL